MAQSQISEFYNNKNVFITGGTGFLGKVLIEKLLRSTKLNKIYVLIRSKKGQGANERLKNIFSSSLFEKLKNEQPDFRTKVVPVCGSCELVDLGLSTQDKDLLISDVNIVFHLASSVSFFANLVTLYEINCKGTQNVLTLCKEMEFLKVFIYVSTAYSNSNLSSIDEMVYDTPLKYTQVEQILKKSSVEEVINLSPKLIGTWPNRYTFSKALAENVVRDGSGSFPIGIFRPAMVIPTHKDPLDNWSDSRSGPTIIIEFGLLGWIQFYTANHTHLEIVPVDLTISALIAAAWDVCCNQNQRVLPVYNYVSSPDNPITNHEFLLLTCLQFRNYPSQKTIWVPNLQIQDKSTLSTTVLNYFHHFSRAIFLDFLRLLRFQKPEVVQGTIKILYFIKLCVYFANHEWSFSNNNIHEMWDRMNEIDKNKFNFDMKTVQWPQYLRNYTKGLKTYLLKESLSTLPEAKARVKRFQLVNNVLQCLFYLIGIGIIFIKLL